MLLHATPVPLDAGQAYWPAPQGGTTTSERVAVAFTAGCEALQATKGICGRRAMQARRALSCPAAQDDPPACADATPAHAAPGGTHLDHGADWLGCVDRAGGQAPRAAQAAGRGAGQHGRGEVGAAGPNCGGAQLTRLSTGRLLACSTGCVRLALLDANGSGQSGGGDQLEGWRLRRSWDWELFGATARSQVSQARAARTAVDLQRQRERMHTTAHTVQSSSLWHEHMA